MYNQLAKYKSVFNSKINKQITFNSIILTNFLIILILKRDLTTFHCYFFLLFSYIILFLRLLLTIILLMRPWL